MRGIRQYEFEDCPHHVKRVAKDPNDKWIFICMQCHGEC